jgi:hypothetical protein
LEAYRVTESVTVPEPAAAPSISSQAASIQGAFWNDSNLKDDFCGIHQVFGDRVGGIADGVFSTAWVRARHARSLGNATGATVWPPLLHFPPAGESLVHHYGTDTSPLCAARGATAS